MKLRSILPLRCPSCRQSSPSGALCSTCASYLTMVESHCLTCAAELNSISNHCGRCQKDPTEWSLFKTAWHFEGLCRYLVHRFKYEKDSASAFGLWHALPASLKDLSNETTLVPMPMSRAKFFERGFNQAEWFADKLAKHNNLKVWKSIQKTKDTKPLEGMSRKERYRELKDVFKVTAEPPKHITLIDDVFTTGASVSALAKTLKHAGAEIIHVWTLSATPLK